MTTNGKYPQCEKMAEVHEFSQRCAEFVLWLNEKHGILLAKYDTRQDACRNCEHEDGHRTRRDKGGWSYGCTFEDDETGKTCECESADFGNPHRLYPQGATLEKLLAGFFDIDLKVVEAEKQQMLAEMREANHATSH